MADAESRAKLYLTVLKHTNTLDVNWKAFAEELGITLAGNAQRKVKEALKRDGFQLSGGRIGPLGEDNSNKTSVPTPTKRKPKVEDSEDTPKKKSRKAKKEVVKDEAASAEQEEDNGESS